MKKLIFLAFIILIFSCQKESCYTCTTVYTTTTSGGGYASGSDKITSSTEQCNISRKDADKIEQSMSTSATVTTGGVKATTVSRCECTEQ